MYNTKREKFYKVFASVTLMFITIVINIATVGTFFS